MLGQIVSEDFVEPDGPAPGDRVAGKYVLSRLLGQGGYGSVWEGENVDLGKRVAVKLIEPQHATSAEVTARFRREARAAGALESEHIVQVYDVGHDAQAGHYLVMELLRGEDLRHKLDRVGRIDPDHAVDWAHQIALALAKAHAAGVVHRDLKPANVFLHAPEAHHDETPETLVKLVDFGVSKLLSANDGEALTVAGRTVGTPQYMSPEQVLGQPSDPRGDLWALGVVLFEMLAGTPPYPLRETFRETAMAIAYDPAPALRDRAPDVPEALAALVARALEKDPALRFPDGAAFAEALVAAWPRAFESGRASRRAGTRPPPTSRSGARNPAVTLDAPVLAAGPASPDPSAGPASGPPSSPRRGREPEPSIAPRSSSPVTSSSPGGGPHSESTTVPVAVEETTRIVVRQSRLAWLVAAVILGAAAVIVLAILSAKPKAAPTSAAAPPGPPTMASASAADPDPPPASVSASSSASPPPTASTSTSTVAPTAGPGPKVAKPAASASTPKPESDFGSAGISSSF